MKPISERADELFIARDKDYDGIRNIDALRMALDEWQASVEERLSRAYIVPPPLPIIRSGDCVTKLRPCGCPTRYPCDCPSRYQPEPEPESE